MCKISLSYLLKQKHYAQKGRQPYPNPNPNTNVFVISVIQYVPQATTAFFGQNRVKPTHIYYLDSNGPMYNIHYNLIIAQNALTLTITLAFLYFHCSNWSVVGNWTKFHRLTYKLCRNKCVKYWQAVLNRKKVGNPNPNPNFFVFFPFFSIAAKAL